MPKLTVAIGTLLLIVITGALLAAACGGGLEPDQSGYNGLRLDDPDSICTTSDQACRDLIEEAKDALRPTPLPLDPEIESIFMQDPVIRSLLEDGLRNQDFWLRYSVFPEANHGDAPGQLVGVELALATPASYSGKITLASGPCDPFSNEGYVEPGHECLNMEREFRTEHVSFSDATFIRAQVYLRQGTVANLSWSNPSERILQDIIQSIIERP